MTLHAGGPYVDSGALAKLYIVEPGSAQVQESVEGWRRLSVNSLQESELRNAIEAAAGREVVRPGSADGAVSHFEHDIRAGRLIPREHDWEHVWRRTMELSKKYTREILCRTIDIVHVALAEKEEAGTMVTGDRRQAELCRRIGLEVTFIDATRY